MIDGVNIDITFDRAVIADAAHPCPVLGVAGTRVQADGSITSPSGWDQCWVAEGDPLPSVPSSQLSEAIEWSRVMSKFPGPSLIYKNPPTSGGEYPLGAYLQVGADYVPRMVGMTRIFVMPQTDKRLLRSLAFDTPIPAPTTGTAAFMSLYTLTDAVGLSEYPTLASETFTQPSFWSGVATSIAFDGMSYQASPIITHSITGEVSNPSYSVAIQSDRPLVLMLVLSLTRMCFSPGFNPGTRYGLLWSPSLITLT